jgi:glycerophosphoryl diester phosphodiesterase
VVKASGAMVWSPNYLDIDPAAVASAHALGLSVIPWTINETANMERFLGMGVDGIITDRPDRLRAVLAARGITLPRATAVHP